MELLRLHRGHSLTGLSLQNLSRHLEQKLWQHVRTTEDGLEQRQQEKSPPDSIVDQVFYIQVEFENASSLKHPLLATSTREKDP